MHRILKFLENLKHVHDAFRDSSMNQWYEMSAWNVCLERELEHSISELKSFWRLKTPRVCSNVTPQS